MLEKKELLTGNEAIARGFYEAGGVVATSYPGSPTVDIISSIKHNYDNEIFNEFSTNEKVALEVGIGASFAGARTMVSMKHVGVNIAADPLMTFTETYINGGFILISGDDPGMASSQNEQDNRIFAKFANMPILDPSDSQEAKEYVKLGLGLSEKYHTPLMLRITSRLCHSRSPVVFEDRVECDIRGFTPDQTKYCMIPPHTFEAQHFMKERLKKLSEYAYSCDINKLDEYNSDTLIITSGLMYHNLKELKPKASIYKLGIVYPLSYKRLKELCSNYNRVVILEEMMPFIENELKINGISCKGKEFFSFTNELNIDDIANGLEKAGIMFNSKVIKKKSYNTVARNPMFCSGCPHRPVFDILKKANKLVIGDIGCYSLGIMYPYEVLKTNISMGASVGIIKGMKKALRKKNENNPLVAVIGDGTFFHSGLPSFVNLSHQLNSNDNITIIILNNGTTAMTGGQPSASSGYYTKDTDMKVDISNLLAAIGIERVTVVDQFNYKEAKQIINNEIKHNGLSVIITTRPCALKYRVKDPYYFVDETVCISCRSCIRTNCPPIQMKKYDGVEKLKSSINPNSCVGCSICAQVCPVNAIKSSAKGVS